MESPRHFRCRRCGQQIPHAVTGSEHRNHCPLCLWSVHLDQRPGDRAARCGDLMEPIAVWARSRGEWALVHRCRGCGSLKSNRIAADDHALALMSLAVRAIAAPPFPLEHLDRMIASNGVTAPDPGDSRGR